MAVRPAVAKFFASILTSEPPDTGTEPFLQSQQPRSVEPKGTMLCSQKLATSPRMDPDVPF